MSLRRFVWKGLHLRGQPDACDPEKSPCAINVRSYSATSVRTRPGYVSAFATGSNAILDARAYAAIQTDDNPRLLACNSNGGVWLDTGVSVGNLAGPQGPGFSMLPFRPGASPQSWMYVYGNNDARKFSAPSNNNVTAYPAGIAEPQNEVEFAPNFLARTDFTGNAANWSNIGTASSPANGSRSNDVVVHMLADPVLATRYSCQPGGTNNSMYSPGMVLNFLDSGNNTLATTEIELVLPPVPTGNIVSIQAIYYDSGNNGFCTIVPTQLPVSNAAQLGYLQRGSLLQLGGAETVLVLSANDGPSGLVSIRASTNNTWSAGNSINGLLALVVNANTANIATANNITSTSVTSNLTAGLGALNANMNPFNATLGGSNSLPQSDDYLHISFWCNNSAAINEMKWLFNVDPDTANFNKNVLYFSVRPSDLVQVNQNNASQQAAASAAAQNAYIASQVTAIQAQIQQLRDEQQAARIGNVRRAGPLTSQQASADIVRGYQTQIDQLQVQQSQLQSMASAPSQADAGLGQWSEILFPISSLTRIGTDTSKTLFNTTQVQVLVNAAAACNIAISSLWVGGGSQPDTGNTGIAYQYRIKPRSTVTGAVGNPSPVPVYGQFCRRQSMVVVPPDLTYDSQIDVYDVYRYGGTVTSWRYIGTGLAGNNYTDNFWDTTAQAGQLLVADDFQPWPSIDVPFKVVAGANGGNITLNGTIIIVSNNSFPASIARWLPGTLVQVNNLSAYPLWARPVSIGNNSYVLKFGMPTGAGNGTTLVVQEPIVGVQPHPYCWGPDAQGTVFGVGDALRPGVLSWAKPNAPDEVSDASTLELTVPSEPLLGGEIADGISYAASTQRWWALFPNFTGIPAYQPVERQIGRGMVAPYGHSCDGLTIYFWAKDCIASHQGGPYTDLTSADLYPLFPHEGVAQGVNVVRNGQTFYAPDYSRCGTFRLTVANKFLYADYQDQTGTPRTLVLNLETGAWVQDQYANPITRHVYSEQQPGGILSAGNAYPLVWLADQNGYVWKEQDLHNDNNAVISCSLATYEWDGGSERSAARWYDFYLDCLAGNNITVQPQIFSANAGGTSLTTILAGSNRQLAQIPVGDGVPQRFLGLYAQWTDNFAVQNNATTLYQWGAFVAPDGVNAWRTPFFVPHGLNGYWHVPRIEFAYIAANNVTVALTSFDGQSPANNITLPATGNNYRKYLATFQPNKGQLYQIAATSNGNFQIMLEDTVVSVGPWARQREYVPYRIPLNA